MRTRHALFLVLLAAPGSVAAQAPGARWIVTLGVEGMRYGAAAQDTVTAPAGAAADLRPSGRLGVRVALQRALGAWRVGAALGWAQGDVEAGNDVIAIRDRTADLSRYRVAGGVERRLTRLGAGELAAEAGPTLDLWMLDGTTRTRVGAECALALRLPMGTVELENRVAFGISASPLEEEDVGGEFELRALRALEIGVGVRVPL